VYFKLMEPETNSSRQVLFSMYGSQTIFKSVVPRTIDFGVVQPETSHSQSLSVTETSLDRFAIKRIESSTPSLDWTIQSLDAGNSLRRYKVTFTLHVGDQPAGRQSQIVHVITDSRFSPDIEVPITFDVAPRVSVVPSVIALGEVPVGEARKHLIRIKSAIGRPFEVKLKNVPPEATCRLEKKADCVELIVTINLPTVGLWQKNIVVNVISDSHEDVVEIKCSGVGKQRVEKPLSTNDKSM
jgi:hypothetical protein